VTGNVVVNAVAVYDDGTGPGLYYAGQFSGGEFNNIARWDGHTWSNVGGGVTMGYSVSGALQVSALAVYDDDGPGPRRPGLYAAGDFLRAGGVQTYSIARWDGAAWEAVLPGINNQNTTIGPFVTSAAVFQDELYVSGSWMSIGTVQEQDIARWDGSRWASVGGGFDRGNSAYAMAVFDDGSGPALYAAGGLSRAGGMPASGIARWDGVSWSTLNGGLTGGGNGPIGYALAVYDAGSGPGLYVGGNFAAAGGVPASNIARWGLPECPANCDGSRNASNCATLDVSDFICFLGRFAAHDQRANCDTSSTGPVLNVNDFVCFQSKFAAGCP
jgi:hypothetical protein